MAARRGSRQQSLVMPLTFAREKITREWRRGRKRRGLGKRANARQAQTSTLAEAIVNAAKPSYRFGFTFGKESQMKDFDRYKRRAQRITAAAENSGNGLGMTIAWLMIIVGVVVTGVQTHALAYNGMRGSLLYEAWLDVASWLPVVLLEGTAVGLILGRL